MPGPAPTGLCQSYLSDGSPQHRALRPSRLKSTILLLLTCSATAQAQDAVQRLKQLSVEELFDVEVTSVSKSAEPLFDAAAAIAVVTGEDMRRAGATSIPEALRGTPGLHVAQETATSWAVSSRGFSSVNSEKLLVLSDTRSIYTPLYSGVFWDVQDYLLEDIDRVEVIRGPGAALWGSNAVNGVINIQTKSAAQTRGGYVEAQAGSEQAMLAARYGGTLGGVDYRVFAKHTQYDATDHPTSASDDRSRLTHAGFRSDWNVDNDQFTVQSDVYRGEIGRFAPTVTVLGRQGPEGKLRTGVSGGNLLARWTRQTGDDAHIQLRGYYDRTHRNDPSFRDDLDTFDLDFQQRAPIAQQHALTWGLNYRLTNNRNVGKGIFALAPASSRDTLVSGFVQDRFTVSESLYIDIGTKLEHNDFSGVEVQPSLRAAWNLSSKQLVWAAVSRAVRVPTRIERDIAIDVSDPAGNPVVRLLGNEQFDSEKLLAYELGHRWQALPSLSFDLAAFRNQYQGLASMELGDPFIDPNDGRTVYPVLNMNLTDGRSQGVEALIQFTPLSFWQLTASYSNIDLKIEPHGQDINRGRFIAGATPRHQLGLRSLMDLPANLQLDAHARYASRIRQLPDIVDGSGLPSYTELDLRLGWRATERLEVSLIGQNLLHSRHIEFGTAEQRGQIERSAYAKLAWEF